MVEKPWQDEEWLRREYSEKGRNAVEISEEFDITADNITYFRNKFGIEAHGNKRDPYEGAKYRDKEWLNEQYWEKERTMPEIADECDCSAETIRRWLNNHDLGTRDQSEATRVEWKGADERRKQQSELFSRLAEERKTIHPFFVTREKSGYVYAGSADGDGGSEFVALHRLLAVAEYGIEAVKDKHIHHENQIPWDNRPENIEPLTASEHMSLHNELRHGE
jgi:transposase-like protein